MIKFRTLISRLIVIVYEQRWKGQNSGRSGERKSRGDQAEEIRSGVRHSARSFGSGYGQASGQRSGRRGLGGRRTLAFVSVQR